MEARIWVDMFCGIQILSFEKNERMVGRITVVRICVMHLFPNSVGISFKLLSFRIWVYICFITMLIGFLIKLNN